MAPIISPENTKRKKGIVDILFDGLASLGLEPRLISPGRVEWLRGGLSCIELEARKGVDVAILLSNSHYAAGYSGAPQKATSPGGSLGWLLTPEADYLGDTQTLYRVDYTVRGNIKGILPNRIISKTALKTRGLVKRRIEELMWEVPAADRGGESSRIGYQGEIEGQPPGPGEVWEGGPHQKLAELLNHDAEVIDSLKGFGERGKGFFLSLSIVSDRWGESIRISCNLWIKPQELLATYASPSYLGIVNRIGGHIKEVRREFGGLAF